MNSLAYKSPIVRDIILRIIKVPEVEGDKRERHILNTDLIPRVSERTSHIAGMQESFLQPSHIGEIEKQREIAEKMKQIQQMQAQQKMLQQQISSQISISHPSSPKQIVPPLQHRGPTPIQNKPAPIPSWTGYGRLSGLMMDPGVTHIECTGPNNPIRVVKRGQTQITNIALTQDEIKKFFEYISEKSSIPLAEGVFRVVVDNILFNAVISELVGTKFIIKKNVQLNENYSEIQ